MTDQHESPSPYQIAAYYFPEYHPDPRNDRWHAPGWTEWELIRRAEPRFPGHQQPKAPLWGYQDESDPAVMAQKIDAAADHGLTSFIFDWYWHEQGPFLNGALDRGFLGAPNNERLQFALMWANHDWINLFPAKRSVPAHIFTPGAVSRAAFEAATDHMVRHYFGHPSYWRIDGRPYFSVYELQRLIQGLGGIDEARATLESFRAKVRAAGQGDLHLNAIVWGLELLPGELAMDEPDTLLTTLGFDSVTSYVWIHHARFDAFPAVPYPHYARRAAEDWDRYTRRFALPYYPNVTMGWDPSPRTVQSDSYDDDGYPFTAILTGNTPAEFGRALERARAFLDEGRTSPPILTVNAWNEWTEGSYLEPDTLHGLGYLEQIKRVFGAQGARHARRLAS